MTTPTTMGIFTYMEWATRLDRSGKVAPLINLMSQCNSIYDEMMSKECQNGTSYDYTQVVLLPTVMRRQFNQGVPFTQAAAAKQVATAIQYADQVRIDKSLAELNSVRAELRASEIRLHMQAMSQQIASDFFYSGSKGDPTQFQGLANIYWTTNTANSAIAGNVVNGGAASNSTSCASMWLIGWGDRQFHAIWPKGMPAGMVHEDKGLQQTQDSNSNWFWAWTDWLEHNIGICVEDWRWVVRMANLDTTLFGGASEANLINGLAIMTKLTPLQPVAVGPVQESDDPADVVMARPCIYYNRTVDKAVDIQAQNKNNVLLKMDEWDGHPIFTYRGIPLRIVDKLTNTESALT
jgi:hypothetical protein